MIANVLLSLSRKALPNSDLLFIAQVMVLPMKHDEAKIIQWGQRQPKPRGDYC